MFESLEPTLDEASSYSSNLEAIVISNLSLTGNENSIPKDFLSLSPPPATADP